MNLRDYQIRTLDAVWAAMQYQTAALMVAPCSAGKTIMFAKLIQRLLRENPGFRALILVDREVLVTQAAEKLRAVAPELALSIGIVCASAAREKILDRPVTIASRQTLDGRMDKFPPVQMCIADEAHLLAIPHPDREPDQYGRIIARLWDYNPNMRLVGCTATPYRLGSHGGYIFGSANRPDSRPYWAGIDAEITTAELLAGGYVTPLSGLARVGEAIGRDLNAVGLVGGEYNLGQLSDMMRKETHVQSVVEAWKQEAAGRRKTIVFTVSKEHCEAVCRAFEAAGVRALPVHSGLPEIVLEANMRELQCGVRSAECGTTTAPRTTHHALVFVSIAMLTTGLDVADVDCLILARPTKSAALFKQILGRGQRLAPGKTDCLVIDLVGAFAEFGTDMDHLRVAVPGKGGGEAPMKECPGCEKWCHASLRYCPHCGAEFEITPAVEAALGRLERVKFEREEPEPEIYEVERVEYRPHTSKQNGRKLVRVVYGCGYGYEFSEWICLPDYYDGYAVEKARAWWAKRTGEPFPETVEEFLFLCDGLPRPRRIAAAKDGKYERVVDCDFEGEDEDGETETWRLHDADEVPF